MNVAALELCKELYELSGWDGCREGYSKYPAPEPIGSEYRLEVRSNPDSPKRGSIPAYDLGYLLRKLPKQHLRVYYASDWKCWGASIDEGIYTTTAKADTPEDAACKLAIELFKAGVLVNDMVATDKEAV